MKAEASIRIRIGDPEASWGLFGNDAKKESQTKSGRGRERAEDRKGGRTKVLYVNPLLQQLRSRPLRNESVDKVRTTR